MCRPIRKRHEFQRHRQTRLVSENDSNALRHLRHARSRARLSIVEFSVQTLEVDLDLVMESVCLRKVLIPNSEPRIRQADKPEVFALVSVSFLDTRSRAPRLLPGTARRYRLGIFWSFVVNSLGAQALLAVWRELLPRTGEQCPNVRACPTSRSKPLHYENQASAKMLDTSLGNSQRTREYCHWSAA
jgi:hypothetical protein